MLNLQNLRPGEKVLTVLRRHWIVYILIVLYFLVGICITIGLYFIFGFSVLSNLLNILFWLFFSMFLYIEWLNHELDLYIVSNNRIIGVEQVSFLNRNVSECNLGQVQEVNSATKGFFANMLNYGTLIIQTAGNISTMEMDFCPDAIQQARKVLNIVDSYRDEHGVMNKVVSEFKTENTVENTKESGDIENIKK